MTAINPIGSARDASRNARIATLLTTPLAPAATLLTGAPLAPILICALVFAAIAYASAKSNQMLRSILLAVALIGQCFLITAAFAGHDWQIDTHMFFFAALAIIATTGSIQALAVGVVLTAVHHLSLGFLLPSLVYPSSDVMLNFGRSLMHAAIVLFEAAFLMLSIRYTAAATAEIETARNALGESAAEATLARTVAERARERALLAAELTRKEGREAAVAVEQISSVAHTAAENSAKSQKLVGQAGEDAMASARIITMAKGSMDSIKESSDQIGHIVGLIDEIARRTDLLALNAAVESARAGDAGRGFAVVANEVRKLAQQSADATLQIRTLVKTSSLRVHEGANLVDETGLALDRISTAVSTLNAAIADIAHGAREQFAGLQQLSVAINRIDAISVEDDSRWDEDADKVQSDPPIGHVQAA